MRCKRMPCTRLSSESDGNDENDDDQLARELAKEFMQRLQNSNM